MKININNEDLLKGIQKIQNIALSKTTLPVLNMILIEAQKKQTTITATNLYTSIIYNILCEVKEEGSILIPCRTISDIVRELPSEGDIIISNKKDLIIIEYPNGSYEIPGMSKEDFPALPVIEKDKKVLTIKQQDLLDMIQRTIYAVSNDEVRYVLNGIYFIIEENKLFLVATDGRRIALFKKEVKNEKKSSCIIPTKTLFELLKNLDGDEDIDIYIQDNIVNFKSKYMSIVSQLIEGHFPKYKQVIPKECKEKIKINKEKLLNSLRRALVLTSDKYNSVKLTFNKNILEISINSPDRGKDKEQIKIDYQGDEMSIAFNPDYLISFLKNEKAENVYIELTDSLSSGVFKPDSADDYVYIVMPMKK
jgi:DNA polymerase-3 subunit beta